MAVVLLENISGAFQELYFTGGYVPESARKLVALVEIVA